MKKDAVAKKIEVVERLLSEAWVRLAAARDVVLLSDQYGEDVFTWDEKDDLSSLALFSGETLDRMRSRAPR